MLFWHSKSYFHIQTDSENRILTFEILFWHSIWVGKSYFDIQNPILTFELSRKMLFLYTKSYFDNRTETENRIFTFEICFNILTASEIVFLHSKSVLTFELRRKSYFDIRSPILTFELSRKIIFWHSKSYFDIRTES